MYILRRLSIYLSFTVAGYMQTVYYHDLGFGSVLKALVNPSQRLSEKSPG